MFENVIDGIFSAVFLAAILRVTTPILLPSLGALISEKAGVLNIGLEGMMLSAAFTGVVVSAYSQDWFGAEAGTSIGPWLGLLFGVCVSLLMSFVLALFHLDLKGDLFLSGIALNIFGSSATVAIMFELTGDRGNTSTLASLQMPFIQLPEFINDIPLVGGFLFGVFDNQSVMTWLAFIAVFVVAFFLYRMPIGMHLRAVGENPEAAASVGINVKRIRYMALLISGFFAGLGGIHMSMGYLQLFQRDMTNGRGFIALVTPSLGGGTPIGTMVASSIFGFFDALGIRMGSLEIPSQLPQSIPYFATVLALVIYALQRRISQRVSEMRTASGASFDAQFWQAIQRISILHMLLMMFAVIGVVTSGAILAAPNGFGGEEAVLPGLAIGAASIALFVMGLPFVSDIFRIQKRWRESAAVTIVSLGAYLAIFLSLFASLPIALGIGLLASAAVWFMIGGRALADGK
ncbi:MAG: iron chelate uptake ABC transporter family permease subunit [Chloroflexi bacterium]|nr:iron chelate uptake ABC transporter family permease subunit [Chloroflexota bacterium]MCY3581469.1 iron chelate uptake ABC transporter family permease subunit [Chloroflexota bacterium]MCY3717438.1 iron chelate uptake ABC transporter family permease subunit [Chloroflexota bacterium]MDE2651210.1 iron chelate uptake ABC transporter family permease subunit [Chloroflexota bacterium]MXX50045.1 iron chelate uptake ABC transporter family permease subunit [Chloroflexota bacterium]